MYLPKVSIIILNWNGWKDTIECLESLYQINYPKYEIILVDNNSSDNSIKQIKSWAEGKIVVDSPFYLYNNKNKPIKVYEHKKQKCNNDIYMTKNKIVDKVLSNRKLFIIRNDKNLGFAAGNNIALKQILKSNNSSYVLLLNNDTVVDKNFLIELVKIGKIKNNIGAVGSINYNYFEPDKVDCSNARILWFLAQTYHGQKIKQEKYSKTQYVVGSCILLKTVALKTIGLFNEKYFCYSEDVDLCLRLQENKFISVYSNYSKIYHKISSSSKKIPGDTIYYKIRNLLWVIKTHNPFYKYLLTVTALVIYKQPLYLIRFLIGKYNFQIVINFYRGIYDGVFKNPLQLNNNELPNHR